MTKKVTGKVVVILLAILLVATAVALAGENSREATNTYWRIVGDTDSTAVLARVMNGQSVPLAELASVTAEELMAFAADNRLPIDMARYGWYMAMAENLRANPGQMVAASAGELTPFLSMPETWRDSSANAERRTIRRSLTEAEVRRISEETGLPGGFVAWLMLDDEWHEDDWEDVNDWREGRSSWQFADWADARDLRERYGAEAVVTDDDVERTMRKNGYRYDD